ncbi:MAG: ABC transporter permease [Clostridiales bacterium]|nr:ABC transporter permease [Clostridiales bacterium]
MGKKFQGIFNVEKSSSILSSLAAIVVGLFVGFLVLLVSSPGEAFGGFGTILIGGAAGMRAVGQTLYVATPIIMTGLSVAFANKTGLFNIGASGQFIVGAYVAIVIGVKCTFFGSFAWIFALLGAILAGALWGALPGILKAFRNVNEVISCIMMNYIGMYLVNYLVKETVFNSLTNQSQRVAAGANVPKMGFDLIFKTGSRASSANGGILIAIAAAVIIYLIIEKTKFGYELKACGLNRHAAKYAGVNEKFSIVMSMVIAGAMSGLGGALLYLAGSGTAISVVDVLAPEGFNGIPVALLALNNPIGVIFAGIFIAYLSVGGLGMQMYSFAPQVIEIVVAIIIYFSAFALVFKGVIQNFIKGRKAKAGGESK